MRTSLEFFLGLLSRRFPAHAAQDDLAGPHGPLLRLLQRRGFLARNPGIHPAPSCPHCGEGVPYRIQGDYVCSRCGSTVDAVHLFLWPMDLEAFLRWLAGELKLRGGIRDFDGQLWQLGTWEGDTGAWECFYWRDGPLGEGGRRRLAAYRSTIILYGLSPPPATEAIHGPCISLLEILRWNRSLRVVDRNDLLRHRGNVRFDPVSGTLRVGDVWLGGSPQRLEGVLLPRLPRGAARSLRPLLGPEARRAAAIGQYRHDGGGDLLPGTQESDQEEVNSADRPFDRDDKQAGRLSPARPGRIIIM